MIFLNNPVTLKHSAYRTAEISKSMVSENNQDVLKVDGYTDNGFKQVPIRRINSILVSKDNIDKVLIDGGEIAALLCVAVAYEYYLITPGSEKSLNKKKKLLLLQPV